MKDPVAITSISSISPLGGNEDEIWKNYRSSSHFFREDEFNGEPALAAFLPGNIRDEVIKVKELNSKYRNLDDSVLYAILAGRNIKTAIKIGKDTGINIGSSRGATGLYEKYHSEFLETGKASTYTSPSTTLGNISSWVAQDLQLNGPAFSHSVTCSTGMHSILNGVAWLNSGMARAFLAGASEAPLTSFTLAQMKAMKIYAKENSDFPCRALDMKKNQNTMILGEGAGFVYLNSKSSEAPRAFIKGIGYANEQLTHGASLSKDGKCLQRSMKMAIGQIDKKDIDAIVMHAPGTIGGDLSEVNAVKKVFGNKLPALTSNKWQTGHSFAVSGILSLQMAILMLEKQEFLTVPFSEFRTPPEKLENILINSVGFGGNAVSILIGRDC